MVPNLLIPYGYSIVNNFVAQCRDCFVCLHVTSTHGLSDITSNTRVRWCCVIILIFDHFIRELSALNLYFQSQLKKFVSFVRPDVIVKVNVHVIVLYVL